MKKWEDIVKERLEGYESTLPEGSYAEFQKLREAGKAATRKKAYPLVWTAAVAVAASLAAVLFLRQPALPEGGVQLVQQQPVEVQLPVADSLAIPEPEGTAPLLAQVAPVKAMPAARSIIARAEPPEEVPNPVEEPVSEIPETEEIRQAPETVRREPFIPTGSPFIPENQPRKKVNLKVAIPVAGGVLGTGALALLATNLAPRIAENVSSDTNGVPNYDPSRPAGVDFGTNAPYTNPPKPVEGSEVNTGNVDRLQEARHYLPVRLGVSARIPVWNNLYMTSGLEYSVYTSRFTYSVVGEKTQVAQYLGIPLRLDWVFPLGKLFDAYAGAGLQADYCLAATWDGEALRRDKINLSLGTAAGVQINPLPHVGLFVEPQLCWRVPTGNDILLTYRTRQPWMFSVSAGVRINL